MLSALILSDKHTDNATFIPVVPEVARNLSIALRQGSTPSPAAKRLITLTKEFVAK